MTGRSGIYLVIFTMARTRKANSSTKPATGKTTGKSKSTELHQPKSNTSATSLSSKQGDSIHSNTPVTKSSNDNKLRGRIPKKANLKATDTSKSDDNNKRKSSVDNQPNDSSKRRVTQDESSYSSTSATSNFLLHHKISDEDMAIATNLIENATAEGASAIQYKYQNQSVSNKSLKGLHGKSFINDEVMNMIRHVMNNKHQHKMKKDRDLNRSFLVPSSFVDSLLGSHRGKTAPKGDFLGVSSTTNIFSSSLKVAADKLIKKLGMKSWIQKFDKSLINSPNFIFKMVHKRKLDTILFQVNIPEYHWFIVEVNFGKRVIVTYCSLIHDVLQDKFKDATIPLPHNLCIYGALRDRNADSMDYATYLSVLCNEIGIRPGNNAGHALKNLYRPLVMQEVYSFLCSMNDTTEFAYRINMQKWSLILDCSTPQQTIGSNACALYCTALSEMLLSRYSVLEIDTACLETYGRFNMALICCKEYGKISSTVPSSNDTGNRESSDNDEVTYMNVAGSPSTKNGKSEISYFCPMKPKTYLSKSFKQALQLIVDRYEISDSFSQKFHDNQSVLKIIHSYFNEFGGYYITDLDGKVRAAATIEFNHGFVFENNRNCFSSILVHYTSGPSEYLKILLSYICMKHSHGGKNGKKYFYASIPDIDPVGLLRLKRNKKSSIQKLVSEEILFWASMNLFKLSVAVTESSELSTSDILDIDRKSSIDIKLNGIRLISTRINDDSLMSLQKFDDNHHVFGAYRSDIIPVLINSYASFFQLTFNRSSKWSTSNNQVSENNFATIFKSEIESLDILTHIDPYPTDHYLIEAVKSSNNSKQALILRKHHIMGYIPVTLEDINPNTGAVIPVTAAVNTILMTNKKSQKVYVSTSGYVRNKDDEISDSCLMKLKEAKDDGYQFCCAWISCAEMIKEKDILTYNVMWDRLFENSKPYQYMSLISGRKATREGKESLCSMLRRKPFGYQFQKVKLPVVQEEWLKDDSICGDYICHLITSVKQSSHAIGLSRISGVTGKIFDSFHGVLDFIPENAFSNFNNIFPDESETVTSFLIVVKIDYPRRKKSIE